MSDFESTPADAGLENPDWMELARAARSEDDLADIDLSASQEAEFLIVRSDGVAYGIAVDRVREIVRMRHLTPVPRTPSWLLGVISLRGEMVEVLDLRDRLGSIRSEPTRRSRIVVLRGPDHQVAGVLVDGVDEVDRMAETDLLPAPDSDSVLVPTMYVRNGEFVSILDLDRVLEVGDV